jgi:hypothetical protein
MGRWQRALVKASLIGLITGVLVGGLLMYIAWTENLSMTVHDGEGGNLDWSYWLMIGASWAVPAFVVGTVVSGVVLVTRQDPR